MKSTLLLDSSYNEAFDKLTDEQLGSLTRALMKYNESGEIPSFSDKVVDVAFALIRKDIDVVNERRKVRCKRNRENAKKRWAKKRKTCSKQSSNIENSKKKDTHQNSLPVNYDALLSFWNKRIKETGSKMPTITHIDNNRRRLLADRMKEYGNTRYLQKAFEKAFVSPFLNGKNKNHWIANIDWILKANNFSRVLDGNFNPKESREILPTTEPVTQETLSKERAERAIHDAERKKATEDKQRMNIMLAIKAAEQNPHSTRAKVAYIAYNDGTMSRLGICWTPPVNTMCNDTQSGNRQVAQ